MSASYPTSVKTFVSRNAGDVIQPAHTNDLQDEVNAIETGLRSGLAHAVVPDSTANNRDLGSSTAKFRDLYLSGLASVTGVVVSGGASGSAFGTTTDANKGLAVAGSFTASGATGVGLDVINAITGAAGQDVYGARISPTLLEAGSGTHANLIGLLVNAPAVTAGAAAVTQATTLYIGGPPVASGALAYALYVLSGEVAFGGAVTFFSQITPGQITANQNDYSPAGLAGAYSLRLSSDAARNVTGLLAPTTAGNMKLLLNLGSFDIVLVNESGSSTAAHRFKTPGGTNVTLTAGTWRQIYYSAGDSRWIVLN